MLRIERIEHDYAKEQILQPMTLQFERGKLYTFIGRSGSGKTTLLNILSGLLMPTKGHVYWEGEIIDRPIREMSYVFQRPNILEWQTVEENILLPYIIKGSVTEVVRQRADTLLHLVGLQSKRHRFPDELSGGERARVAIARALITDPRLLLMDEPFSALDAWTKETLQQMLLNIQQRMEVMIIFVTHDIQEAVFLSDHCYVLQEGKITYQWVNQTPVETRNDRYRQEAIEVYETLRYYLGGMKT